MMGMTLYWSFLTPSVIFGILAAATHFLRRADKEQGSQLLGWNPLDISAEKSPILFQLHLAGYWVMTIIFGLASFAFLLELLGII